MSINMEILSYKSMRTQIFADPPPKRNSYYMKRLIYFRLSVEV